MLLLKKTEDLLLLQVDDPEANPSCSIVSSCHAWRVHFPFSSIPLDLGGIKPLPDKQGHNTFTATTNRECSAGFTKTDEQSL